MPQPLDTERRGEALQVLASELTRRVIGQPEAISAVVDAYEVFKLGVSPVDRPVASFLFLGPTGVGKTYLCESLAEILFGTSKAVLKVDCAEFQHSHEIAKLIGSPPGYVGHRETTPRLAQHRLNQYWKDDLQLTLLLFDEVEKASYALWDLLLGLLDRACISLGDNTEVDAHRAMVFLTSNLGGRKTADLLADGHVGFAPATLQGVGRASLHAAAKTFSPEFLNRLDKLVAFQPLSTDRLEQVLELEADRIQRRLLAQEATAVALRIAPEARAWLLSKGTSLKYGARHLRRTLEEVVFRPLVHLLSSGQAKPGSTVWITLRQDSLCFSV